MTTMRRALAALTAAALLHATTPHGLAGTGTEGIDRTAKPHAGTVRDAGSTPAVSTTKTPRLALQKRQRATRAYRTPTQARTLTIHLAHAHGYHSPDVRCLLTLWHRESRFQPQALNRRTGAGGIPQILGLNPSTPTHRQIERGLTYIAHRYGSPCQALKHHDRRGWY